MLTLCLKVFFNVVTHYFILDKVYFPPKKHQCNEDRSTRNLKKALLYFNHKELIVFFQENITNVFNTYYYYASYSSPI